jgi:hypothetical protein
MLCVSHATALQAKSGVWRSRASTAAKGTVGDVAILKINQQVHGWGQTPFVCAVLSCCVPSLQELHAEVSQQLTEATALAQPAVCHNAGKTGKHSGITPHRMFLSMDFEWWEKSSGVILEIGWSLWDTLTVKHRSRHWVIKENLNKVEYAHHADLCLLCSYLEDCWQWQLADVLLQYWSKRWQQCKVDWIQHHL